MERVIMQRVLLLLLGLASLSNATSIYETPTTDSKIISSVDPSHKYTINTQDWVEITDDESKEKGWAKLSELKSSLSTNSEWSYQWRSSSSGSRQTMHYKPYSDKEIIHHMKRAHNEHKKVMANFQAFWDDLEGITSKSHTED